MASVRRRCVFYVSGFDPKGAAHYHALYRDEAAKQAAVGGLRLEVGPRKRLPDGNSWWSVQAEDDAAAVATHYEFMRWDDIVRAHWPRGRLRLWREVLVASWFNLRHGSLWRMFTLCWPPALALFIPFVVLCGLAVAAPLLSLLAGRAAAGLAGHWAAAAPAVAAVLAGLGWIERRMDDRFNMYWLMRSYAFTRLQALGRAPELEARLEAQATRLAQRLREDADDEVLVVGHSSGAIMAACIVQRALRLAPGARVSLLTLGQCFPLLSTLPQARRFRAELAHLRDVAGLDWVDVSAPPDASCFALCDPLLQLQPPAPRPDRPKLVSPRFAEMFDPQEYRRLRRDKLRMHFQYLMASELPAEYDYFRLTAGARTLAERFARLPSVTGFHTLRPFGPPRRP